MSTPKEANMPVLEAIAILDAAHLPAPLNARFPALVAPEILRKPQNK
jgi:hypothetical protein